MPLVAGIFDLHPEETSILRTNVDGIWPCKWHQCERGLIGAHAFRESSPILTVEDRYIVAIDGTSEALDNFEAHFLNDWRSVTDAATAFVEKYCASLISIDLPMRQVYLASDPVGAIPLYYRRYQDGFVAASVMRPIRAVEYKPDIVGAFEFLRLGYTLGGRSVIEEIQRVLPGQFIQFDLQRHECTVEERSRLWAGTDADAFKTGADSDIVEEGWERLTSAVYESSSRKCSQALMMSAGWDSRTLLASFMGLGRAQDIQLYVHGDPESRELALVGKLAGLAGAQLHVEPIVGKIFDPAELQNAFALVENVVFPQWIRAGRILEELGVESVGAGVLGEVLGGHYGIEMLLEGPAKATAVLGRLTKIKSGSTPLSDENLRACHDLLSMGQFGKAWYLQREFWESAGTVWEKINSDIESALLRLRNRGVATVERAIEAFISEHRGVQYINQQILSCRVAVDVNMPYCKPSFVRWSAALPAEQKIHNRVNREMINKYQTELLSLPLASTLFRAGSAIIYQEFGRLLRSLIGQWKWRRYVHSQGEKPPPRFGWVNYEFLRKDRVLEAVVDDLRLDWWDSRGMLALLEDARSFKFRGGMHPIADQLMKVYTVDLMLR